MDFKIDFGPWKTVYEGKFSGHSVEIVSNPENFFLVFVFDVSENGEKIGALIEGYKAYIARGPMESFIETFPKPSLGVLKSIGSKTVKLFFSSFDPIYLDFRQEDFLRSIDNLLKRNIDSNSTIIDLARASSLDLKELSVCPASEYSLILGDPFTMCALIGGSAIETGTKREKSVQSESIPLGLSKSREIINENVKNLRRTIIVSPKKKEYEYAQYIITENLLLDDIAVFIFDDDDYFSDLKSASHNEKQLSEALISYDPLGFPMKKLKAKEEIKISVKDIDFGLAMNILGTGDKEFNTKLTLAKAPIIVNTPEELAQGLLQSTQLSGYEQLRAERISMLLGQQFPNLFGENPNVIDMAKDWPGNLGRATVVNIKDLTPHEKVLFVRTILRLFSKKLDKTSENKFSIIIPDSEKIFSIQPEKADSVVTDLENKGVGFVFGAESKGFNQGIEKNVGANISVVSKNDAAVSITNGKSYRVLLRPSLSGNPSFE